MSKNNLVILNREASTDSVSTKKNGSNAEIKSTFWGTLLGTHKNGGYLVKVKDDIYLITGNATIFLTPDSSSMPAKRFGMAIGSNKNDRHSSDSDITVHARCRELCIELRITGASKVLSRVEPKPLNFDKVLQVPKEACVETVSAIPFIPPVKISDAELNPVQKKSDRAKLAFERVLDNITAQLAKGIDPQIGIDTFCRMTNRSRASVYRDIRKSILPEPIKVGGGSFFKHSVMVSYMAGK